MEKETSHPRHFNWFGPVTGHGAKFHLAKVGCLQGAKLSTLPRLAEFA
jgi:hypothetical protein